MKWRWLFLVPVLWACDDYDDCGISEFSEELYIEFNNIDTKSTRTVTFNSMDVQFSSGNTISYVDEVGGSQYLFPIDLEAGSTTYVFRTDTADYTFEFEYTLEAIIENPECGPIFRVKGLSYNEQMTTFDSVAFRVTELTKLFAPHVEVYF